jgi:DNA (cytosine-5)-methyltransferase 1
MLTRNDIDDENSLKSTHEIKRLVPDHDIICGGFPCQPFSKSGEQRGVRDTTRGTLFFDIVQIIDAKRPKYVFLENVRNIAGPRHENTWRTVISSIREMGYHISAKPLIFSPHLLPPERGGAPQVRDRVFILAVRDDLDEKPLEDIIEFNTALQEKSLWNPDKWKIRDFLDPDSSIESLEQYAIGKNESMYVDAWNYFVQNIDTDRLPGFPIWVYAFREKPETEPGMPDWEVNFRVKNSAFFTQHRSFINEWMKMPWGELKQTVEEFPFSRQRFEWQASKRHATKEGRTLDDLVLQFRPSGIRVKPPTYLPALVAISQTSVVGPRLRKRAKVGFRKLTPREAARLQSLPDRVYSQRVVSEQAAYKQLGNAVNVGIVKAVAEILLGREVPKVSDARRQYSMFSASI